MVNPPIEIAKKGVKEIRNFFRQLKEQESQPVSESEPVYEAKLIIIGEAGAGKTTLERKIKDPDYQLNENEPPTRVLPI